MTYGAGLTRRPSTRRIGVYAYAARSKQIIEHLIKEVLPHGSGIDSKWEIESSEKLKFECCNKWHTMDANGYYCGYVSFTVKLNLSGPTPSWRVEVNQADIDSIVEGYETSENEFGETESNAPYLDDLDDCIYQAVASGFRQYFDQAAVNLVSHWPHLLQRSIKLTEKNK